MLIALLASLGLIAGAPALLVTSMAAATLEPRAALVVGAAVAVAARRQSGRASHTAETSFHQAVSAELNAGASLRTALGRASETVPELPLRRLERAGRAGLPVPYLKRALREGLAHTGAAAAAALSILEETGGHAISTFDSLALIAQDEASIIHDRRASTAQVRASALLVGGLPVAFIVFLAFTGRFAEVAEQAPVMLMIGGLLLAIGVVWMGWMLRAASLAHRRRIIGRHGSHDQRAELLLAQLLLVGLTAGLSLEAALARAQPQLSQEAANEVGNLLRRTRHSGMATALAAARDNSLYRILSRAYVSGAPLAAAVATFISQTREAHRAEALTRAKKLPVKLLVPLSLLILPGFVFLTVGPTLVHSLNRVLAPVLG